MADDGQIVIQIVLDDGSVQQGFATIKKEGKKAADDTTKAFRGINDALDEISPTASRAFSRLQTIISNPFIAAGASIAAVGATIAGAFKLTLIGDQALQAERSFNIFAQNAGVNAKQLKEAFSDVSLGLVDVDDALAASRIAVAELGSEAAKLPQVFKLAQNVAVTTGQNVLDVYNQLNQAILSGNTRSLRSIGIFLDGEQALGAYAQSLGKTANNLTSAEKQQAVLNATLEKGNELYKNSSTQVETLGQSVQVLSTETSEFFEEVGKQISQSSIGDFFRNITTGLAEGIKRYREELEASRNAFKDSDSGAKELDKTTRRLKEAQEELLNLPDDLGRDSAIRSQQLQVEIAQLTAKKAALEAFIPAAQTAEAIAAKDAENAKKRADAEAAADIAREERQKRLAEYRAAEEQYQQKVLSGNASIGGSYQNLGKVIELTGRAIKTQAASSDVLFKDLANTINTGFIGALSNVGVAIANNGNAFEALGASALGIIGGLAQQIGQFFILQGLAQKAVPWFSPSAGVTLAAGVALQVFGAALSASSQKAVSAATNAPTTAGTGGGGAAPTEFSPGFQTNEFDLAEVERQQPNTEVNLTIMGDVLDSDGTSMRIVSLLNEAFDKKGVTLRRGMA